MESEHDEKCGKEKRDRTPRAQRGTHEHKGGLGNEQARGRHG